MSQRAKGSDTYSFVPAVPPLPLTLKDLFASFRNIRSFTTMSRSLRTFDRQPQLKSCATYFSVFPNPIVCTENNLPPFNVRSPPAEGDRRRF